MDCRTDIACSVQQRYILSLMAFLAIVNAYTMRSCLAVAIPYMSIDPTESNKTHLHGATLFDWTATEKGQIKGAFFYGYVITHVPGAILCNYFGAKNILGLGILSTAIFSIVTPQGTEVGGKIALICIRFVMGLGEGTTFPALSALLASWVPEKERGKLGSFVFGGGQIGHMLGTVITGYILGSYSWHTVFYFFGALAVIWFGFFMLICHNSPAEHPFISESEEEYLRMEMDKVKHGDRLPPIPWRAIFTSLPMFALVTAQIGHDWGFYVMANDLPQFIKDIFNADPFKNGWLSALPFFVMWVCATGSGFLCDYMINNNFITVTNARKALTGIAAIIPGVLLLVAVYVGKNLTLVMTLFTVGMGFMGTWYPGMKVNPLDLSPNYAATIMAITNGIGAITGALAPYVVGALKDAKGNDAWAIVFWITLIIFIITTVSYTIWASAEVQPWNDGTVGKPNRTDKSGKYAKRIDFDGDVEETTLND